MTASPALAALPADGLVAFVKRACPTCTMIEAEMRAVARKVREFRVVSQDDPAFPAAVEGVIDDRELDHSWRNGIEATPTLIHYKAGREVERVMGWDRAAWRRLSGIADLGEGLRPFQPG